ncbi:MAG: heavy metal translocating P-type ATPase [Xanthomonadales bacterium]|nr:heavy metal translocating P-type ATPase [Xanthomonadales bacterium]
MTDKHDDACGSQACQSPTVESRATGGVAFRIANMDCPTEEAEIRRAVEALEGVRGLRFDLSARVLRLDADPLALQAALAAIRKAGFDPQPLVEADSTAGRDAFAEGLPRLLIGLLVALAAEAAHYFGEGTSLGTGLGMGLSLVAIALAGASTYRKGLAALFGLRLNMNALMSVAVTGAFLIGEWPEAAMVMVLYALAEAIEARALDRARNAIKSLMAMAPDRTELQTAGGGWQTVPVADVAVGARVRVRPGERIPLDGLIRVGQSAINQAPVTGESVPVDKAVGDGVFAATINLTGMLELEVTAGAKDTTLARIIRAVEEAQSTRAPTQQFVDRFAAVYTPAVFVVALLVAVASPLLLDWTWTDAVYRALVLLVIACPCALVIATPVTVVSGLAAAARRGIVIKGGVYLEQARRLRVVALDKTGTLTEGRPRLVAHQVVNGDTAQVLGWTAALSAQSDHPVAQAIAQGLPPATGDIEDFTALPGRGVRGRVDGQDLWLGNHRLIEERGVCSPATETILAEHETQGRTTTLLASATDVLAIFAVADTIKDSSRAALEQLHRLGVRSVMLTGDNKLTARTIATQAGIDDARGDLLPEDKLGIITELQAAHGPTAMTGDGINDAPALARADIGFAMGGTGTDTALEAADIVVMNDDLRRIPETIVLSQRTHRLLWQNIGFALGVKLVFLVLALFGEASMWMAVFADMGASLIVVFNGLRILR